MAGLIAGLGRGAAEASVASAVYRALSALVREHYVERCPEAEPMLPERFISDKAKKGIRGGSRNRGAVEAEGYFQAEVNRIQLTAQAPEADRFRLPASVIGRVGEDEDEDEDEDGAEGGGPSNGPTSAGTRETDARNGRSEPAEEKGNLGGGMGALPGTGAKKRKRGADGPLDTSLEVRQVLWRVNCEEYLRRMRHQVCCDQVRERFDPVTASIMSAMLYAGRHHEPLLNAHLSVPFSLESALEAVRSFPGGSGAPGLPPPSSLSLDRVRASLQALQQDPTAIWMEDTQQGPGPGPGGRFAGLGKPYAINMKQIVALAKLREVEAMIALRYGAAGCRIFRLLHLKGQLEQKQIGEMAMVPLKEARELLYRLLQDEYLLLQEIAKSADRAPSRTFYLFRLHLPAAFHTALDHLCLAASNVRLRLKHEIAQEQEVMALLEQRPAGGAAAAGALQLTAAQRQQLERIRKVAAVLEASLLKLDSAIMLFSAF
eukprot:TRINITY_DN3697_c0_g1_i2.p1 TRINITY_DN3697_c0_g1~~TRINITY_DN3697_c0_g1_i2.p1  ORF type:complete len:488 (+),score=133.77 TRINITY_DN3697_c0_g1_i2:156-1619(+)